MPDGDLNQHLVLDTPTTSKPPSKQPNDKALLAAIGAHQALTRASGNLAAVMYAGGDHALYGEFWSANRALDRKLVQRIRATLPATAKGADAKRKHFEDDDGTEFDDPILALCARHAELLDAYNAHPGEGASAEEEAIFAEYSGVRDAILASRPRNMETVLAKAKVAQREAPSGSDHCLGVINDLLRIGGAL